MLFFTFYLLDSYQILVSDFDATMTERDFFRVALARLPPAAVSALSRTRLTGSATPRLHGLQVGVATYIVSRLQGGGADPQPVRNLRILGYHQERAMKHATPSTTHRPSVSDHSIVQAQAVQPGTGAVKRRAIPFPS